MKKLIAVILALIFVLSLIGCSSSKLIEGSEKTYYGTVTDIGMSVVNEGDREGRPYIIVLSDDNIENCFWIVNDYDNQAVVGQNVTVESVIEEQTNLLVAFSITPTYKNP